MNEYFVRETWKFLNNQLGKAWVIYKLGAVEIGAHQVNRSTILLHE